MNKKNHKKIVPCKLNNTLRIETKTNMIHSQLLGQFKHSAKFYFSISVMARWLGYRVGDHGKGGEGWALHRSFLS